MTVQIPVETLHSSIRMLSDEQVRAILSTSLDTLARTGVVMKNEAARELLLEAGAHESADYILMSEHVAIATIEAPSRIPLYSRLGKLLSCLEEGRVYFGSGSDRPFTLILETQIVKAIKIYLAAETQLRSPNSDQSLKPF